MKIGLRHQGVRQDLPHRVHEHQALVSHVVEGERRRLRERLGERTAMA